MSAALQTGEALGSALLGRLPAGVAGPAYDRSALRPGIAHIGVGAFHRAHQAEFTEDLLAVEFGRWGIVGINIRPPLIIGTLGRQNGLYTRLLRENERVEARVIGSLLRVVDSQDRAEPALAVLASPEIDLISLTVTEKGYCHRPASGELDEAHPDILHDLAYPETPRSVPGLILRAMELRRCSHDRPVTVMSCDNIPSNGAILERVVTTLAERRGGGIADWIARNAAFPSTMVDRIVPATSAADIDFVEQNLGYRDDGVVVGEPFRQWVIENRFAGRFPAYDRVGASIVDDVEAFEHLKMRILNGAQTTLSYLGVLAGHEYSFDDMADPLLASFIRRMLVEESLPTLQPIPGVSPEAYVEQSLSRLTNTAIRHRNHQIATDGSQKIVQRILSPIRERLARGHGIALLSVPVAAWMTYLIRASERFGRAWRVEDPYAARIAAIADRIGNDPKALSEAVLAIDAIFVPELSENPVFRASVAERLAGLLSADPIGYLRTICEAQETIGRKG
ncbi:mannitol dehydrogenase family protein [Kaistia algarum]|uniref:mannitol dehydrogenase family protein n=1 Tax=Kaistia algarum TaxID=2083279 RepID=UPI000CE90907|nr:mannitol dehydrogenase family protein [Kaistia algarum]MCX5516307.1 mannitol dehydrogenase family protein [Kaistia algarum]PPE78772.1 mannitol dehydrogenase family protein [Kaistia algarum]